MSDFVPELGQAMFSNTPWQEMPASTRVISAIDEIAEALVEGGLTVNNVSDNMGGEYSNDTFTIRAYCWCDGERSSHEEGCPPNFEYGDLKVCWYKHSHRSATQNREMSRHEVLAMTKACLDSIEGLPPKCQHYTSFDDLCGADAVQKVRQRDSFGGTSTSFFCNEHRLQVEEPHRWKSP